MKTLSLLFVLLFASVSAAQEPNVVVIVADDVGYSDLGCYGGEIETPHLDAIAENGLRFTNFYVNNMCWPTRASLMTGLYPKTALPKKGSAAGGLHPDATTLPEALRDAGYTTLVSGKWHLSDPDRPDGPDAPHHRGFDRFYGTIHGASDFFAPADLQLDGKSVTNEWEDNPDFYYTDAITDHALEFLTLHDAAADSTRKPFFLYLAYTAAHWPLHARPEDIAHYKGRYAEGWDAIRRRRHARMKEMGVVPAAWRLSPRHADVPAWEDAEHNEWQQRRMEVYAAQITCMDRNIGRVIDYLKKSGAFDNTLILYHHDNGACHVEYTTTRTGSWTRAFSTDGNKRPVKPGNIPGLMPGPQTTFQSYGYGWANASNTPFRLFKQYDHEGGIRSPLVVSWPEGIERSLAGHVAHQVCHITDVMPTILDAARVSQPDQKPFPMEGKSFLSVLKGEPDVRQPREALFWEHGRGKAVRLGDLKLVSANKGPWELYNLAKDGTELDDLADESSERVRELEKRHAQWDRRTNLSRKGPAAKKDKRRNRNKK